jgi:hypothetical protein
MTWPAGATGFGAIDTASGHCSTQHFHWNGSVLRAIGAMGDETSPTAAGAAGPAGSDGANGAGYGGTSTTLLSATAGSKTITTQAGLAYVVGSCITLVSNSTPAAYVTGLVTATTEPSGTSITFNAATGAPNACSGIGSGGPLTDWNLSIGGYTGATGASGSGAGTINMGSNPSIAQYQGSSSTTVGPLATTGNGNAVLATNPTIAGPSLGVGASPVTETWTVGAGGVTANTLVQLDGSAPSKIVASTTGAYGVAMTTQSAAANVEVARFGSVNCVTDTGGSVAGDLVLLGTGTVVDCKDSGQTSATAIGFGIPIIGIFRSTTSAGSTALVELTLEKLGRSLAYSTLTDGPTISWNVASALYANATVTIAGNRTLNVSNLVNGGQYVLKLVQDGSGSRGLALGAGCTWKVSGSGSAGAITPSTAANAIDGLTFSYDGANCLANFNANFH